MIFDDTNPDVVETPEVSESQSEPSVQQEKVPQAVGQSKAPQDSFRELRDKTLRLERERDEAMRRIQEMEARIAQKPVEEDNDIRLGDDDIAEGKHLKKLKKELKEIKEELSGYKQQSSMATTEVRLKSQFPDFDKVVSKENIDSLRALYPEIAQTLNTGQDLYATGVSAYTMIKKLGIHADDAFTQEKEVAQKNAAKPKPMASLNPQQGDSPLSHANAFANGLTEDLKEQLRKEMFAHRRSF